MRCYSLSELAARLDGVVCGDGARKITGIASLARAGHNDLCYFDNPVRSAAMKSTRAAAVLLTKEMQPLCPIDSITVDNPFLAIAEVIKLFQSDVLLNGTVHPSAQVDVSAILGNNVSIGANSVISKGVRLGNNVRIGANCIVEPYVCMSDESVLHHSVILHEGTQIGSSVRIDSGAVIGALPFNAMKKMGHWYAGPAIGGVVVSDRCQIGSNTVIDRGSVCDTCLEEGVFLDNLIQIAHDVVIGAKTAVAGCAAIGAHTVVGMHCVIGGASTLAANLVLADDVVITGMSTVSKSLLKPGVYSSGTMVCEHQKWRRNAARFKNLDLFVHRLQHLEQDVFLALSGSVVKP